MVDCCCLVEVVCYVDCMRKLCSVEVVGGVGHVTWRSLTAYRESLGKDERVVREFKAIGYTMAERRYPADWSMLLEDGRVQESVRVKKL